MLINTLKAVPAAGKTKAILEHIYENGQKAIVSSISRQLSRQSYDFYNNLGGKGVIIDSDNKHGYKTVSDAIEESDCNVIFITHSGLMNITDYDELTEYHLYIDEVPELVTFTKLSFTQNIKHVLQYCEYVDLNITDYQDLKLDQKQRDIVESMAVDAIKGFDDISVAIFPLLKALLTDIPIKVQFETIKEKLHCHCFFINDMSSAHWKNFKSVTLAGANIEDTFTGKILKHFNNWEFVKSDLESRLLFKNYPNSKRINIYVMSESNWSKYESDKEIDGVSQYTKIKNRISKLIGDNEFIYTRNSYRARFSKGVEVPYNPHGLNMYSNYQNVVVMFSFNPLPWQVPILKELSKIVELDDNDLLDSYVVSKYLEPAFQLCARSNIRRLDSDKEINLYVPDMRLAIYMKNNYFMNATISTEHVIEKKIKKTSKQVRNRLSFQSMFDMSDKERYRYMYYIRKLGRKLDPNDKQDIKTVKKWIKEQRSK